MCKSDKSIRLFLFLADYNKHAWFKKIGKGKIQIAKGGCFNKHYRITVPENFMIEATDYI